MCTCLESEESVVHRLQILQTCIPNRTKKLCFSLHVSSEIDFIRYRYASTHL